VSLSHVGAARQQQPIPIAAALLPKGGTSRRRRRRRPYLRAQPQGGRAVTSWILPGQPGLTTSPAGVSRPVPTACGVWHLPAGGRRRAWRPSTIVVVVVVVVIIG
jgi:hypothetical protein